MNACLLRMIIESARS